MDSTCQALVCSFQRGKAIDKGIIQEGSGKMTPVKAGEELALVAVLAVHWHCLVKFFLSLLLCTSWPF
jgi:hypothetical protein